MWSAGESPKPQPAIMGTGTQGTVRTPLVTRSSHLALLRTTCHVRGGTQHGAHKMGAPQTAAPATCHLPPALQHPQALPSAGSPIKTSACLSVQSSLSLSDTRWGDALTSPPSPALCTPERGLLVTSLQNAGVRH